MKAFQAKLVRLQDVFRTCTDQEFRARVISFGLDERTFSVHYLARKMCFLVGFRQKEAGFTNYIEIVNIFITDPQDRGKGWGTRVFESFLPVAAESTYSKILLHPKDDLAKNFWSKMGFGDNKEKNLSMELNLDELRKGC